MNREQCIQEMDKEGFLLWDSGITVSVVRERYLAERGHYRFFLLPAYIKSSAVIECAFRENGEFYALNGNRHRLISDAAPLDVFRARQDKPIELVASLRTWVDRNANGSEQWVCRVDYRLHGTDHGLAEFGFGPTQLEAIQSAMDQMMKEARESDNEALAKDDWGRKATAAGNEQPAPPAGE